MPAIQDVLGLATTLVVLGMIAGGVMKVFQIANDMQEIKSYLKDLRRPVLGGALGSPLGDALGQSPVAPPPIPAPALAPTASPSLSSLANALPHAPAGLPTDRPPTAEELVRAIHAQDFKGDEFPL